MLVIQNTTNGTLGQTPQLTTLVLTLFAEPYTLLSSPQCLSPNPGNWD